MSFGSAENAANTIEFTINYTQDWVAQDVGQINLVLEGNWLGLWNIAELRDEVQEYLELV